MSTRPYSETVREAIKTPGVAVGYLEEAWRESVKEQDNTIFLDALLAVAETFLDKGPWRVVTTPGETFLESDDFTHDARLYVNGDFVARAQQELYAKAIAEALNAKAGAAEPNESDLAFSLRFLGFGATVLVLFLGLAAGLIAVVSLLS